MGIVRHVKERLKGSSLYNFNQVDRDRWVERQAKALPPGSRVLDVGAGATPYRPFFGHCEYKTQDFQQLPPDQFQYGRIDYVSDATNIPVPDASFDAILCTEVIEHVPEPIAVLREFARILRPGGKVLITAPLGSGIHQAPHHYYGGYTPYWYRKFLTQVGFEEVTVEPNGGFFKHYSQESIRFAWMTSPTKLKGLRKVLYAPVWLALLPIQLVVFPLLCHAIDHFDESQQFTIGYHVVAVRAGG